ncbi:uncharacterized protein LOC112526677 isoform X2 [Cynara cardunculus var. scolymus]|uniref:uncharacterized protein LOC112526677 isoform X2 n=1 Tax=Cynara cardunculus var. scolymus TaxID=59895 RepID=UPI000D622FB4|nr:uncharacterized protein LOC112526677 isoform X2 [Cynara cardunculus var. scolymus]
MESQLVLGVNEITSNEAFGEGNYKLVPWISWDDWSSVRESLFSSSPGSIDLALRRISAWRSRGCLPVVIEVTASIIEIQQKDSFFRDGLSESDILEEDMLTMLYCMAIMRLVNGIVEKTRKKNEVSIAEAADAIGIPRMLIDIRHECSHRDLPSLRLVRLASTKALDWLKAYYWEPQKMAISCPSERTANFRKEIKSKIRELAFSLDVKKAARSGSSVVKGKRSKKHINKALKNLLKLYSSFPSEVVSILLEFLLKALESADVVELPDSSPVSNSGTYDTQLDDWKALVMKLSNKEPEMLLSLLKVVLQMIETHEASKHDAGEHLKPKYNSGFHETDHLSCLFEWLVGNLKDLKTCRRKITTAGTPNKKSLPKSALVHLLRKCLMVSSLGDNHLTTAASVLAQRAGNQTLVVKLNKLASLHASNTDFVKEHIIDSESFYNQQENYIRQAANNLDILKQKLSQKNNLRTAVKTKITKWSAAKSWKPCPIGMLPSDVGSSGLVPVLDDQKVDQVKEKDSGEVKRCGGKREADGVLENSDVKKLKECKLFDEEDEDRMLKNGLMIGGVWKRVTEDELINMASAVRILV